jgi:two-component system, response regulator PdtaR
VQNSYPIAIADDDADQRVILRKTLVRAGHTIVVEASSGEELVERCTSVLAESPKFVITDLRMGRMDGLDAGMIIFEKREVPFIVVSGYDEDQLIERADECGAFGYLVKPIREQELKAALCIAARRFQEVQAFRAEATCIRQALEDRKIIERAKGILMLRRSLDESNAFKCLQQLARQHRQKLVDVARSVNLADDALSTRI